MSRVVITGMGWITPMGHSIETVWKRLLAGESGISRTSLFDAGTFPTSISAEVKGYNMSDFIGDPGPHAGRRPQHAIRSGRLRAGVERRRARQSQSSILS